MDFYDPDCSQEKTQLPQEIHVNGLENKANLQAGRVEFHTESIIKTVEVDK